MNHCHGWRNQLRGKATWQVFKPYTLSLPTLNTCRRLTDSSTFIRQRAGQENRNADIPAASVAFDIEGQALPFNIAGTLRVACSELPEV